MKKLMVQIIVLIAFTGIANAQKSNLVGSWLMTKAEVKGDVEHPFFVTDFKEDATFFVMGMEFGTWEYNKKNNSLVMKSDMDKDFSGEAKILTLSKKKLVVNKDGTRLSYRKVVPSEVAEDNKNSGLIGMWEFKDVPYSGVNTLLTFTGPDEFKMILKEEGSESRLSGTWIFDKQASSLIMIGLRGEDFMKGESKIIKIGENGIEFEISGTFLEATRKVQNKTKIERLTFSEDEFYNEDGDYKYYEDEEKLPWRNWSEMKLGLLNVKELVYDYSVLIDGTDAFDTKALVADVTASMEDEGFKIDNIFNGYDRYNLPEDAEFPENSDYSNPLYPLDDVSYRISGNEQITTPAGTFNCTIVEAIGHSGVLKKLWMINDKTGIYARIIEDDPDPSFGHYFVYELKEIK